jgi:hypothetical protein
MFYIIRSIAYAYEGLGDPTIVAVLSTKEAAEDFELGATRDVEDSYAIYVYKIQQFPEANEDHQEQVV